MSSTSSDVDLARTVTSVIAGAAVALVVFAVIVVIYIFRERALFTRINEQAAKVEAMNKLMETRLKLGGTQFESLEDLLKPYKKHLLQSAYDLQSRLTGQLTGNTIFTFKHTRKEQDGAYMVDSTIYFFAEFLGWMEVIRSKIVFITGSAYAEALNALFDSIRFMFTGESPIQGCDEKHQDILQLFIVDIRSIGNAMLTTVDGFHRPITVDVFLRRLSKATEKMKKTKEQEAAVHESLKRSARISTGDAFDLGNDRRHFASAAGTSDPLDMEERVDVIAFQKIIEPLKSHIVRLADLCEKSHYEKLKPKFNKSTETSKGSEFESKEWSEEMTPPTKRLAILQVLFNRLISILDDAVPWDTGPKFDPNEEPQYIQRSVLITPQVKFLSETQKGYLRDQLYFKDDPNFSFRGFREDIKSKPQAYRDKEFWPGAFPPMEPRSRPEYFKRNLPSIGNGNGSNGSVTTALSHNTQGLATAGAQQRARARRRKALKDAKDDFPLNDDPDDPNRDKPRAAKTILDSAAAAVGATFAAAVAPRSSNRVAPEHSASALKKRVGVESGRVGSVSFQADQQRFMVKDELAVLAAGQEASSSAAGPSSQAVHSSPLGRAEARLRPSPDAPPQQDPSFASYVHPSLPPSSVNVSAGITAGVRVEDASPSVGRGVISPTRTRLPPLGQLQKRGEHLV